VILLGETTSAAVVAASTGGLSMVLAAPPATTDPSIRSAIVRLSKEFPEMGPSISIVVRTCREELRGSPADALPELVERLARQRLRVQLT
jgi:hypothetical protein